MIKDLILSSISKVTGVPKGEIRLEFPENEDFGDYSCNIALTTARKEGKKPREFAESLIAKLKEDKTLSKIVEKIEVAGPGFINFWLKNDVLVDSLIDIDSTKEKYGSSEIGKGKTVIVDYSSPNIAKAFGIGHLRSTIIGQALYNLYKFQGYEVVGDNHLGDWGTQFGKLLCMIKLKGVKDFNIEKLEELYVEFHRLAETDLSLEEEARVWFKKLEEGDSEAKEIWRNCIKVSLKEFERIYDLLGVKIDFAFGESYYESEMKQMLNDSKVSKYLTKGEEGARIVDLTKLGIKTPLMFLKKDGGTTYATRDLATIKFRERKWNPDIVIYEVGAEQTLHFRQLFAAANLLELVTEKTSLIHTAHGLYLAPDGKKFSTRKGKTIKLEEVLTEAVDRAKKLGSEDDQTATMVGVGAIKYFDLMHSVQSDVTFDWEKIMNMEGNSGPYLQYTVARINSVIEKGKSMENKIDGGEISKEELRILRSLVRFPEIVSDSAKSYAPNVLCNYLYDLAQRYNSFYNKHKIVGGQNEGFKIFLSKCTSQVLKNGLKILGIETPEKM